MGAALELLGGYNTGDTTALTAITMNAGDSLNIRGGSSPSPVRLVEAWAYAQAAGTMQIRSPRMHDNVRGIRYAVPATSPDPLLGGLGGQLLYAQDQLVVEADLNAAAGDISPVCLLLYYEDLPGVNARLVDADYVRTHGVNLMTVENTITLGAAGGWSGGEALNAEVDLMKANRDYALIGYKSTVAIGAFSWVGVETGNLRVGGPGLTGDRGMTVNWFSMLSDKLGKPAIPVFNAANKAGITVAGFKDENAAAPILTSIFVELD